jgi:hypothetical protein
MKFSVIAVVAAGSLMAGVAQASTAVSIEGLYNTGTDASNTALGVPNGATDPHYFISYTDAPAFTLGDQATTFFDPAYVPNDGDSMWIGGPTDASGNSTTQYRLVFDLTGLNVSTAEISGRWGVDNEGEIFLNGVSTGNLITGATAGALDLPGDYAAFQTLHDFTISSGFQAGLNYLDFRVLDLGTPTGLRVDDLSGSAVAVPEPGAWLLMIMGFGAVGAVLRRRRTEQPLMTRA